MADRRKQKRNARAEGCSREREACWKRSGKVVRCNRCGDSIGGRLLFEVVPALGHLPTCIECAVEVLEARGFIDCGTAPVAS